MLHPKKIAVIGAGYVGMSISVLLSQKHEVQVVDIDKSRVKTINQKQSTINDQKIKNFLENKSLTLSATEDFSFGVKDADVIIICTPTDFDEDLNSFDASSVEQSISKSIKENPEALIVIKSTIPIGFTKSIIKKFNFKNIVFSPEFLREGKALEDNLNPSRLIIGGEKNNLTEDFVSIMRSVIHATDVPIIYMSSCEAESVKLFANSYLAMRVGFFNELDNFALEKNYNTKLILEALCLDSRIGNFYNNPSFGYGGYCLPKDVKQLSANLEQSFVPSPILSSVTISNEKRKDYIAEYILRDSPKIVGIYRLAMKQGSDNFRFSSILDVASRLTKKGIKILLYEPSLLESISDDFMLINSLEKFKDICEVIIANRITEDLLDVSDKVFTRDIFNEN